ncbi:MAG: ribosomal RNA small subunit methyltransferase A [Anaerolineaceae bacterium 4572_78]|nr:MAG: ribosomal RNA small subunit methyltransferase A [Anaerolineaceae bacterium 4572_78]
MLSPYQLLKKYNIRPKKKWGQNFLADANHVQKIIDVADITSDDTILEIGAGLGTLTMPLTHHAKNVLALEVDPIMVNILQNELANISNFHLMQADILKVEPSNLLQILIPDFSVADDYIVVANLPYYITSAIIRRLQESNHPPKKMVITVQKEVAQRITARPNDMSLLAVSVQFYGKPTLCHTIPAQAFIPLPNVTSAVLGIERHAVLPITIESKLFFRVVKAGFSQKRKQLKNTLAGSFHVSSHEIANRMQSVGISPTRRPQTLSLEEWEIVTKCLIDFI